MKIIKNMYGNGVKKRNRKVRKCKYLTLVAVRNTRFHYPFSADICILPAVCTVSSSALYFLPESRHSDKLHLSLVITPWPWSCRNTSLFPEVCVCVVTYTYVPVIFSCCLSPFQGLALLNHPWSMSLVVGRS